MDNGLNSKEDLLKLAVDFMNRRDVDSEKKRKVKELLDATKDPAVKYSKVEGSKNFVRMEGVRKDADAVIALKNGEQPEQLYTEEEVARLTTMAGIIAENGTMVEKKPKKEWDSGRRIGSMLLALAVGAAAFCAGAVAFKKDEKQVANNIPQTEIVQGAGDELESQIKDVESVIDNLQNSATEEKKDVESSLENLESSTTTEEKKQFVNYLALLDDAIKSSERAMVEIKNIQDNYADDEKSKAHLDDSTTEQTGGSKMASTTYDEFVVNCENLIGDAKNLLNDKDATEQELRNMYFDLYNVSGYFEEIAADALPKIMEELQDLVKQTTNGIEKNSNQEEQESIS